MLRLSVIVHLELMFSSSLSFEHLKTLFWQTWLGGLRWSCNRRLRLHNWDRLPFTEIGEDGD